MRNLTVHAWPSVRDSIQSAFTERREWNTARLDERALTLLWLLCAGVRLDPQGRLAYQAAKRIKLQGQILQADFPRFMSVYYMLLDADWFNRRMSPALAASWRLRSFDPCRALCSDLAPAVRAFTEGFATGPEEPLLCKVARDLPFDRHFWNLLVGELLLYAAAEIPEIQIAPDTLCCLLAPASYRQGAVPRARYAPIQQVHFGTRELLFGPRCYRGEHAGYNDVHDVASLCEYLASQTPEDWTVADLTELRDVADDEERQEELDFAREWFPALRELYQRASARSQLVICESL